MQTTKGGTMTGKSSLSEANTNIHYYCRWLAGKWRQIESGLPGLQLNHGIGLCLKLFQRWKTLPTGFGYAVFQMKNRLYLHHILIKITISKDTTLNSKPTARSFRESNKRRSHIIRAAQWLRKLVKYMKLLGCFQILLGRFGCWHLATLSWMSICTLKTYREALHDYHLMTSAGGGQAFCAPEKIYRFT